MDGSPTPSTAITSEPTGAQPLSKNAQKRLARATRIAEQKKERRAYDREKKKEKKRQLAEKRAAGELGEEDEGGSRKKARTDTPRVPFKARIVVDLGFDDLMNENEIKSLTSQLAFTYSANRRATRPFESVLFTSLDKRTYVRLEEIGNAAYKRWNGTEWWHESYERLWAGQPGEPADTSKINEDGQKEPENEEILQNSNTPVTKEEQTVAQGSVVYLTADSSEELTELKEGETYIIGGICDHNRYKNLCLNKSKESGIRSARLPIGTFLAEMKTRKVLTVNQTFEILLKWVETNDWGRALEEVVPKRKFHDQGKGHTEDMAQPEAEDGDAVVIDAAVLEEETDGTDEAAGDVATVGGQFGTLVTSNSSTLDPTQNTSGIAMDSTHPEVPLS